MSKLEKYHKLDVIRENYFLLLYLIIINIIIDIRDGDETKFFIHININIAIIIDNNG